MKSVYLSFEFLRALLAGPDDLQVCKEACRQHVECAANRYLPNYPADCKYEYVAGKQGDGTSIYTVVAKCGSRATYDAIRMEWGGLTHPVLLTVHADGETITYSETMAEARLQCAFFPEIDE